MGTHNGIVHTAVIAGLVAASLTSIALVRGASAGDTATPSVFVPISPCRLLDTRPGSDNVGPRATPIEAHEAATFSVWGTNGRCTIPSTATAIATNTTAVNPTTGSFLTVYPADATPRPTASNLNVVAGQGPVPNQVTVGLSASGAISIYNNSGTVDVIVDIVGYYQSLPPRPAHIVWVATSGGDFASVAAALASITDNDASHPYLIKVAPGSYNERGGIDAKDFVDIEGSGADNTTITCHCSSAVSPRSSGAGATVRITGHTEIRDLAVDNTGGGVYGTAIWLGGATSFDNAPAAIRDAKVTAEGSTGNYAVFATNVNTTLDRVTATATGAPGGTEDLAVVAIGGSMAMDDVTASGVSLGGGTQDGMWNELSLTTITRSKLLGSTAAIHNQPVAGSSSSVSVRFSQVWGPLTGVQFFCYSTADIFDNDAACPA